jgi:nitrogen PTS system EIIA component
MPEKGIKFSALFTPEQVICGLGSVSRNEAIKRLVELIAATGRISDIGEVYRLVIHREELSCTILGPGIAVPHARLEGLAGLRVAMAICPEGIDYHTGSAPVRLVVLILTPADDPGGYLQAQAALARVCVQHDDIGATLSSLEDAEAVWSTFDAEGGSLPDYVAAGHMMSKDYPFLRESDPLSKAIDQFYRLGVAEMPVIDKDGDLVGVVSQRELLRVCLPEHITWMDDLSPILHFEPFTQVLRNEERSWLADIMSPDYVTLPEDAPAIQVAKEMIRTGASRVFVTRGKKLVGVISIQNFLNKVMRD